MTNLVSTEEYLSTLRNTAQVIESQQRQLENLTPRAEGFDAIIAILSLTNHSMTSYSEDWASTLRRKISAIEEAQAVEAEAANGNAASESVIDGELVAEMSCPVDGGILVMRSFRMPNGELHTVATLNGKSDPDQVITRRRRTQAG